jgi:hypothetical protein
MKDLLHNLGVLWDGVGIVLGVLMVLGTITSIALIAFAELFRWTDRRRPKPVQVRRSPTLPSDWRPYETTQTRSWN